MELETFIKQQLEKELREKQAAWAKAGAVGKAVSLAQSVMENDEQYVKEKTAYLLLYADEEAKELVEWGLEQGYDPQELMNVLESSASFHSREEAQKRFGKGEPLFADRVEKVGQLLRDSGLLEGVEKTYQTQLAKRSEGQGKGIS